MLLSAKDLRQKHRRWLPEKEFERRKKVTSAIKNLSFVTPLLLLQIICSY